MAKEIALYINDTPDSDNLGAVKAFIRVTGQHPTVLPFPPIHEPRHVSIRSFMAQEQVDGFVKLCKIHFPSHDPFNTLLSGALQLSDLDQLEGLGEDDLELLKFGVRPANGPREDAIAHAHLVALDYMTDLRGGSHSPRTIFVDRDALDNLESPVSLHRHHHDELVARSETELAIHQDIMNGPPSERVTRLRRWYQQAIKAKLEEHGDAVQDLDFNKLCQTLDAAEKVTCFVGSSLGLIARLMRKGLGKNMHLYVQNGTFDIGLKQFGNAFNTALNLDDAKFVFSNYRELASLTLMPTDTTRQVEYSLVGLRDLSPSIARRALAFNCRVEAMKLATGTISVDDFPYRKIVLADFTAFLLAFTEVFGRPIVDFASVIDRGGQLVLEPSDSGYQSSNWARTSLWTNPTIL